MNYDPRRYEYANIVNGLFFLFSTSCVLAVFTQRSAGIRFRFRLPASAAGSFECKFGTVPVRDRWVEGVADAIHRHWSRCIGSGS